MRYVIDKKYRYKLCVSSSTIVMILFILTMVCRSLTAEYENAGIVSKIKYLVCLMSSVYTFIVMKKNRKPVVFKYELKNVIVLAVIFIVLSLIFIVFNSGFTTRTILELIYLLLPVIYAYLILNTLNFEQIYKCMYISLILFFVGYIISLNMTLYEIINAVPEMSFMDSFSILESSAYAAPSVTMSIFFLYYREKKLPTILSIVFVFMTFKRISILFVLLLIILIRFVDLNKKVSNLMISLAKVFFLVATIVYFYIMIPANVQWIKTELGIDLYKITMSRTYRFWCIYANDFSSNGFGSTYTFMMNRFGVALEMDLIKILFEMGIVGLIAIVNQFFNIVRKNWYCFVIMIYIFMNLLFSHSMADMFGWLLLYIIIGCIEYKKTNQMGIKWRID